MGLWASHGCWDGGYAAFNRWRHELARAAGYKILEPSPEERSAGVYHPYVDIDWDAIEDKNYQGEWDTPPGDDPLMFLIAHADNEGLIHPQHGVHIARRLEQLLPMLDESASGGHISSMQDSTRRFIDGLRAAAASGEDVTFS